MAGIYIHVPFCKQACSYCNFYFSTSTRFQADYVKALCQEIVLQKEYLAKEKIDTIYFGGGTPSLLSALEIDAIVRQLYQHFCIAENPEITLEANPDDLDAQKLKELSKTAINRLSIGIQSFRDADLQLMNRAHNGKEATQCVPMAQDVGFDNISIDLIYGTPQLTDKDWKQNLQIAEKLQVQHLSSYALTVEENTPLFHQVRKQKITAPLEEVAAAHFQILMDFAAENNWQHYEISNFCKEGFLSKHNTAYWQRKKYLGLGPSAHSYDIGSRHWNIANTKKYIDKIKAQESIIETELLSIEAQYNEYIMTRLRTFWGVDEQFIQEEFPQFYKHFEEGIRKVKEELIYREKNCFILTNQGKLYADAIASDLFVEEK